MEPTSSDDALVKARHHLEHAKEEGVLAMVDLGGEHHFLGWHPVLEGFVIRRKAPQAPEALPAYMALLENAPHVHAGGETPKAALDNLIALFNEVAGRLEESDG